MAKFEYSEDDIDKLIIAIYGLKIHPRKLPKKLYNEIAKYLLDGAFEGLEVKSPTVKGPSIKVSSPNYTLAKNIQENVYMFSAAKTYQQTLEMSNAMVVKKELVPFDDFKIKAKEIFTKYNGGTIDKAIKKGWLEAEYNTAVHQGGNAKKWAKIDQHESILPYLIYSTAGSACPICLPLDGITLPVGHPFWSKYAPANHFNCNCILLQADKEEGTQKEWSNARVKGAESKADVPKGFKYNAGKRNEVFSTKGESKHPYFSVPKKDVKFAERNFNLPIPNKL